jgi:hypothetical protein
MVPEQHGFCIAGQQTKWKEGFSNVQLRALINNDDIEKWGERSFGALISNAIALVCNCPYKDYAGCVVKFAPKTLKADVLGSSLGVLYVVARRR